MTAVLDAMARTSAFTWNGALSNSTTGFGQFATVLDYWAKAGTYTRRAQSAVDTDMGRIFADAGDQAIHVVFGLRLITRKPDVEGIEEVQTGYGRRDEFAKAVVWMHHNKPDLLYRNLHLIPVFGCWKDFLSEPLIDVLDRQKVYAIYKENLSDDLLRKYLPQIRSRKNVRVKKPKKADATGLLREARKAVETAASVQPVSRDGKRVIWAKGFCKFLGINYRDYRKLKISGKAHIWQQQMARKEWDKIHFNGIPGKAMLRHTSQKGKKDKITVFERHGLVEKLKTWVLSQKTVKFTGYPYELTRAASLRKNNPSVVQRMIYDRQFETVLEPMRGHKLGNVLACLDISGSMQCQVLPDVTAYDICMSMGLAFSSMNAGYFSDAVVGFSDSPILVKLKGGLCDRLHHLERDPDFQRVAWGSTNFQGVINLLARTRRENPGIPVSEFPETLLVVSDMQFNPTGGNAETNYEVARKKLNEVGLPDVRIIWWQVNGRTSDFPCQMTDKGCYMISGFDPANIKALMGLTATGATSGKKDSGATAKVEQTPLDGLRNFLSQPIFNLIQV